MPNKNFQTFFDCGFSKIRAGTFNTDNDKDAFFVESEFFIDRSKLELKIKEIIVSLESNSNEYINSINLMLDSTKMLSIGISLSKKLYGSKLKQENVKFLVQEAKQEILKYYTSHNIAHIIINNYRIDGNNYSSLPNEAECHFLSLDIILSKTSQQMKHLYSYRNSKCGGLSLDKCMPLHHQLLMSVE